MERRPSRPSLPRPVVAGLAVGLSGVGLAAVPGLAGAAETLNAREVERTIDKQFAAQGVELRRVTCAPTRAVVGAKVSCTALNPADTKLYLRGRVTSVSGDTGRFSVKAVYGIAKGTTIAREVRRILEREVGQRARGVTCPKRVRIPTKKAVVCALRTTQGPVFDVRVTIDSKSRIKARVADAPR